MTSADTLAPAPKQDKSGYTLILIAVVLAIVAVVATQIYIEQQVAEARGETVTLVRTNKNIEAGQRLRERDVVPWTVSVEQSREYVGPIYYDNLDVYLNERLTREASENTVLTAELFYGEAAATNSPPAGFLWHEISVSSRGNVPRVLRPQHYVDVYGIFTIDGNAQTLLIIESVKVVAVSGSTEGEDRRGSFNTITVELTPEQVRFLTMAQLQVRDGSFIVTIRRRGDTPTIIHETGINPQVLRQIGIEP